MTDTSDGFVWASSALTDRAAQAAATRSEHSPGGGERATIAVFLIGDSTMSDKPDPESNPERGWGQMLPHLFDDFIDVRNHACDGSSTKSFLDEGRWDCVLREMEPGDYVFIQFGHMDQKIADPSRFAAADGTYALNLRRFVTESRARRAFPVLFSSIVRRRFDPLGMLTDTHGDYPRAARAVATELEVPFVDLHELSRELVSQHGPEDSKRLFVWTRPGEFPMYPAGQQDDTHLSVVGATEVARLAVQALRDAGVPLVRHLREEPAGC
jgi:lysophospholipase L1-like esterase